MSAILDFQSENFLLIFSSTSHLDAFYQVSIILSVQEKTRKTDFQDFLQHASQRWVWLGPRPPVWWNTSGRPAHSNPHWNGKKAIPQTKAGKALGPSGIVVEMIRAAGDIDASMICDLAAAIIPNGKVPSYWEQSFIVCLYKG